LPAPHSASFEHLGPHEPLVGLQNGPPCVAVPPVQSPSTVHLPHPPDGEHHGLPVVGQSSVPVVPLSPLHGEHAFVCVSQTGFAAGHVELATHSSHFPVFGPVVAQMVERQTMPPFAPVHGPSPFR
jgi:hypothetical protein